MTLARLQLNHQNAAALRLLHAALARKNCEELNAWFHQRAETKRFERQVSSEKRWMPAVMQVDVPVGTIDT